MTRPLVEFDHAVAAKRLIAWYRRHRRDLPWRRSREPYRIWISEIMLQQTQVTTVIPYYLKFLARFPSLASLAGTKQETVLAAWSGLGYYRRARNLHAAARRIREEHRGRIPRDVQLLRRLAGIGRYTAAAVASIAFDLPEAALDGNAKRVLARLLAVRGDSGSSRARREFEETVLTMMQRCRPSEITQGLMELGALICAPVNPACPVCPLSQSCGAFAAGLQHRLPEGKKGRAAEKRQAVVAILRREDAFLMLRRGKGDLMEGLWEFPGDFLGANERAGEALRRVGRERLGRSITARRKVARFSQSITYRRIQVSAYEATLAEPSHSRWKLPSDARWLSPEQVARLPHGSATGRLLGFLAEARGAKRPRRRGAPSPSP
jgi:A/G-specific adenine glycosylase